MTHINFYHLTVSPLGKALPKLLEKVLSSNLRAVVLGNSKERIDQLNRELWTYTTKVFLPHGTEEDGYEQQQPIFLTTNQQNPNNATILAIVDNARADHLETYEKCLYLFDGSDEESVNKARLEWEALKKQDHILTYWKQDKKGGWQEAS